MKNLLSHFLILSLLLAAAGPAFAEATIVKPTAADLTLDFKETPADLANYCNKVKEPKYCKDVYTRVIEIRDRIKQRRNQFDSENMKSFDESVSKATLDQSNSKTAIVGVYDRTISATNALSSDINKAYDGLQVIAKSPLDLKGQIPELNSIKTEVSQVVSGDKEKVLKTEFKPLADKAKSTITKSKSPTELAEAQQTLAGTAAASFMKKLLTEQQNIDRTTASLNTNRNLVLGQMQNENTITQGGDPPPTRPATSGLLGGMDLGTLAALAPLGLGIAQMMKKPESSISDSAATPGATSPTPGSGASAPTVSNFTSDLGNKAASQSPASSQNPQPSTPPTAANTKVAADNASSPPVSDIVKTTGNGGQAASGKTAGGASGGSGGAKLGGGDASQNARAPSSANPEAKPTDDALQGFGGGGLPAPSGSGSSSGGGAGDVPPMPGAIADDQMRDILNSASENLGENPDGTVKSADEVQMSSEDLFPRVSACIVRSLKQGRVLNGLGDRIMP